MTRFACRARPARGEAPVRLIVFGLVGIALVAVPLWWLKREQKAKVAHIDAAERAASPLAAPLAAPVPRNPDRLGLTFGWQAVADSEYRFASCHGAPRTEGNGSDGACLPRAGDTSCRTSLPLLCLRLAAARPAALATTAELPGFALASRADADARCAADFGSDWRLADYHDGPGGMVHGVPIEGHGLATHRRVWIGASAALANCWNPSP